MKQFLPALNTNQTGQTEGDSTSSIQASEVGGLEHTFKDCQIKNKINWMMHVAISHT